MITNISDQYLYQYFTNIVDTWQTSEETLEIVKTQVPVELGVYVLGYLNTIIIIFIQLIHHHTIRKGNDRKTMGTIILCLLMGGWGTGVGGLWLSFSFTRIIIRYFTFTA